MAHARHARDEPPDGLVRACRAARRRGDDHEGSLPVTRVTLYRAADCQLCERALEVVLGVRAELPFELEIVDIGGNAELEVRLRELLPVVEIDGERAFTYFVDGDALRDRVSPRA